MSFAFWSFAYSFHSFINDFESMLFWRKISIIGWCFTPLFMLIFNFYLSKFSKNNLLKISIPILFIIAVILTIKSSCQPILAKDYYKIDNVWYCVSNNESSWFWLFIFYTLSIFIINIYIYLNWLFKTNSKREKLQANIILICYLSYAILGFISDILFPYFNITIIPDISHVFSLIWVAGIGYSIIKYRLMILNANTAANEILQNVKEILFFIDVDKNIINVNNYTFHALGYSASEIESKNINEFCKKIGITEDNSIFNEEFQNKEWRIKNNKGELLNFNFSHNYVKDVYGDIIGSILIGYDSSEKNNLQNEIKLHKRTENALKKSEEKYRNIFENSSLGIFQSTLEGKFITANNALAKMLGYSSVDDLTSSIYSIGTQLFVNKNKRDSIIEQVIANKEFCKFENEYICKDGKKIIAYLLMRKVTDLEGNILYLEGFVEEITERVLAERALKENQVLLNSFLEGSNDGFFIKNYITNELFTSKRLYEMLGYNENEFKEIKKYFFSIIHQDDIERIKTQEEKHLKGETQIFEEEFRCKTKDGNWKWVFARAKVIERDENGNPLKLAGAHTDIGIKKQVENEYIQHQTQYRHMFENHDAVMYLLNPDTFDIIDANISATKFYGYTREQLTKMNITQINTASVEKIREELKNAEIEGKDYLIFKHKLANGEIRDVEIKKTLITLSNNQLFFVIVHDITNRIKAEDSLRQSEQMYRLIAEKTSDVIWLRDMNMNTIYMSPSVEFQLGFTPEEYINLPLEKRLPPESVEITNQIYQREIYKIQKGELSKDKNYSVMYEMKHKHKNGSVIWGEVNFQFIFNEEGSIIGIHGITRNIDERKRIEEKLKKVNDELEELVANRTKELARTNHSLILEITQRQKAETLIKEQLHEKELLIKEVHHRVKNNMQVIISLLNLQFNAINNPEMQQVFEESQDRIKAMALVHEKLYQSQDLNNINFSEYMSTLVNYLMHSYKDTSKDIKITKKIEDIPIDIDNAVPMGLLINELVTNAFKYAFKKQKTGELNIEFTLNNKDNTVHLVVKDNGCGFPKNFNIDDIESLGLQLVQSLNSQINGELNFTSSDKGTTFEIIFPFTKAKNRMEVKPNNG